ncbi:MAG: sugar phosphate isomerase/epimerase [Pirellulaceae bacterium]|nr:sugar phosphate isomerase/epimerase [Pirellulaceae bacterium]
MYKTLDTNLLEITGRQSEIIELAMTFGFSGINVDMVDMHKRCQRSSFENASRFLVSSKLRVASYQAPIGLDQDDAAFESSLKMLAEVADIAGRCQAHAAVVEVPSATNRLPYPEYFEVIRKRIDRIAEVLAAHETRLALRLDAIGSPEEKQFKFVRDIQGFVALVRACNSKNVGIVLDSWNWHLAGGNVSHLKDIGVDRVALVYLADCKEGVDRAAATTEDRVLPGSTGVIDNATWIGELKGKELPVAVFGAPVNPAATRDAFITQVQDSLNDLFAATGLPTQSRKPEAIAAAAASSNYRE